MNKSESSIPVNVINEWEGRLRADKILKTCDWIWPIAPKKIGIKSDYDWACNFFVWKVADALKIRYITNLYQAWHGEVRANDIYSIIQYNPWIKLNSVIEASGHAEKGYFVIAARHNPNGSGHVAIVVAGGTKNGLPSSYCWFKILNFTAGVNRNPDNPNSPIIRSATDHGVRNGSLKAAFGGSIDRIIFGALKWW